MQTAGWPISRGALIILILVCALLTACAEPGIPVIEGESSVPSSISAAIPDVDVMDAAPTLPAMPDVTQYQREYITINAEGKPLLDQVRLQPGVPVEFVVGNLSDQQVRLSLEAGSGSIAFDLPAATTKRSSTRFKRQSILVTYDAEGTYAVRCLSGCTGSVSLVIGAEAVPIAPGVPPETGEALPAEEQAEVPTEDAATREGESEERALPADAAPFDQEEPASAAEAHTAQPTPATPEANAEALPEAPDATDGPATAIVPTATVTPSRTPEVVTPLPGTGRRVALEIANRGEQLRFNKEQLGPIPAGASVTLFFKNTSIVNPHNWVLLNTDDLQEAAAFAIRGATESDGAAANYLPKDTSLIIAHTRLLPAEQNESDTIIFTAPAPGRYIYVSTVPGQYQAGMWGVLIVE